MEVVPQNYSYVFNPYREPIARVKPGEQVTINRLEQAARLWRERGLSNGGVMAETYHMNIEERSFSEAIRGTGELLNHVHPSDSNRAAPGQGHTDFEPILQALVDIDYPGYLTFELDVQAAANSGAMPDEDDLPARVMEQAIKYIRRLEPRLYRDDLAFTYRLASGGDR